MRHGDEATIEQDVVVIAVPANSAYLAVLRTATAGIAARLGFTLDEIEDLRIAVDEACAMLVGVAAAGAELTCRFEILLDSLVVHVGVPTNGLVDLPGPQSFAWRVLTTLTAEVSAQTNALYATIRLVSRGGAALPADV